MVQTRLFAVRFLILSLMVCPSFGAQCATDGSQYAYSETVSSSTKVRTITESGCPSHKWTNLNPNYPVYSSSTRKIPLEPMCADASCATTSKDLSEVGGAIGILFSAAQVFSAYGGPNYGQVTSYTNSAPLMEGDTFDECSCHADSATSSTYHCHVPPTCLLQQLGATTTGHSPQIGWSFDGFPIYGPRGENGVLKKTCTVDSTQDKCLDDCAGYYGDIDLDGNGNSDGYKYRYYILGEKDSTGQCQTGDQSCADFFPHTPICLKGCLPSDATTATALNGLPACTSSAVAGYTTAAAAKTPGLTFQSTATCIDTTSGGCPASAVTLTSSTSTGSSSTGSSTTGSSTTGSSIVDISTATRTGEIQSIVLGLVSIFIALHRV